MSRFELRENKSGCHCCALYNIVDTKTEEEVCGSDDESWMAVILDFLRETFDDTQLV